MLGIEARRRFRVVLRIPSPETGSGNADVEPVAHRPHRDARRRGQRSIGPHPASSRRRPGGPKGSSVRRSKLGGIRFESKVTGSLAGATCKPYRWLILGIPGGAVWRDTDSGCTFGRRRQVDQVERERTRRFGGRRPRRDRFEGRWYRLRVPAGGARGLAWVSRAPRASRGGGVGARDGAPAHSGRARIIQATYSRSGHQAPQ